MKPVSGAAPVSPSASRADALAALPTRLPPAEARASMPAGFRAGAIAAGIKPSGRPDLGLVAVENGPAAVAAVFTSNTVVAAPIRLSRAHLCATETGGDGRFGWTDAIVATSGSANAATGLEGDEDQASLARAVAAALDTLPERTLALSTGVIGVRLPLPQVVAGLDRLVSQLAPTDDGLEALARAIMTTDTVVKLATASVELPGPDGEPVTVKVSGIAKGVGMIHPRMATMLAVILTDASASPATLHALLSPIVQRTWNQLTVDGDTSTNDTVFLLASGAAGAQNVATASPEAEALAAAIEAVARSLARAQAADGEGASTLITCQVSGAADDADARAVARSVVSSSLLKAAIHGRDPNWGRVASAAGNARLPDEALLEAAGLRHAEAASRAGRPPQLDVDRLRIAIAGTLVFAGAPLTFDRNAVRGTMEAPEVLIRLDLGLGDGSGEAFGCDLTEGYVIENAEYTT
ncbi:MAG TPA: bifunctional glutamate N-acetyltransferase/amino-acid acetyltransferase ArgJ [Candidatus Limnocylindrales bacterium]